MEPEPADVRRVVTMIQGELGGGETVGLWSPEQRQHAAYIYILTGRRERERERDWSSDLNQLPGRAAARQPSSNGRGR